MELSISNNFLSLFIPEQSNFTNDEILEVFKTYIFKLMNMDMDSLIQEQINNEKQNIELHKKYKDFFSGKVDSILKINNLYKSIKDRTSIIKNAIDENMKIIERSKNNTDNLLDKENNILMKDFQTNKKIIKNYNNDKIAKLFSIPFYMIDCFKNSEYDSYLKYYNYIMTKLPTQKYKNFEKLKNLVIFINDNIINFIKNLLSINYDMKIPYNKIYDLLQMTPNKIFINEEQEKNDDKNNNNNIDIDDEIKILSVYILQIELWTKHNRISLSSINKNENGNDNVENNKNILNFFETKIKQILKEIKNIKLKEIFYKYIFDNYIYDYINYIYSIEKYNKAYIKINNFIKNSKIDDISNNISYSIYKISKNYFFNNLQSLLNSHKEIITNYMLSFINIRKFFESNIPINPKTSANKDLLDLKYEIFFIFENNFSFIFKNIIDETLFKFSDKVKTIKIFLGHVDELMGILNDFLYKHGIVLLNDPNLINSYNDFKNILNKIVMKYAQNLIEYFGIDKSFDYNFMIPNLINFNNLLKEIQELI